MYNSASSLKNTPMSETANSTSCPMHPFLINCSCPYQSSATTNSQDIERGGTQDLATLYPEIDETILAGPIAPYKFRAPVANMKGTVGLQINTYFKTMHTFTPSITTMKHDYYSERFALSPINRTSIFAGRHYGDESALSPVRIEDPESLALSDDERHERPRRACRTRKPKSRAVVSVAPLTKKDRVKNSGVQATKDIEEVHQKYQGEDCKAQARKKTEEIKRVAREAIESIQTISEAGHCRSGCQGKAKRYIESLSDSETEIIEVEALQRERKNQPEEEPRKLRRTGRAVRVVNYVE